LSDLVVVAINESDGDLDAAETMLPREINRPLRMLKIEGLVWVRCPISQPLQIEPRARMLQ